MKKSYILLKQYSTVLTLLIALIISGYSCKKESNDPIVSLSQSLDVSAAKEIFYKQVKFENITDTTHAKAIMWSVSPLITSLDSNVVFKVPVKSLLKPNSIFLIIIKVKNELKAYYQEIERKQNQNKFTGRIILRGLRGNIISIKKYDDGQLSVSAFFENNVTKPAMLLSLKGTDNKVMIAPNVYYCKRVTVGISIKKTANQVFPTCSFSVEFIACANSRPSLGEIRGKILSLACEKPYNIDAVASEVDRMLQKESMDLGALWESDEQKGQGLFDPDNPDNPVNDPDNNPVSRDTTMQADFYKNPKAMCALAKLMENNFFKSTLNNFAGTTKPIDLTFKLENIPQEPGFMTMGNTIPNPRIWSSTNIDVTIAANLIDSLPSISVALTLLHEGIHAEIFRKMLSIHGPSNLNARNFPSLFNLWVKSRDWEGFSHEFMANYYVNIMANAIKEYDNNKFGQDHYKALAWSGLKGTEYYNDSTKVSAVKKKEIDSLTKIVLNGRSKQNCNDL